MKRAPRLAALLPFLALLGCFEDRSTGTSTETENAVTARSISVDSVLEPWERIGGNPTVATLRLEASNFEFKGIDDSGRDLAVRDTLGQPIPFEIVDWDRAAARGRIHVRLDSPLQAPRSRFELVWMQSAAHRSDSLAVWKGIPYPQILTLNSVLVDDFEGTTTLNTKLPVSSFWFLGNLPVLSGRTVGGLGRTDTALHLVCTNGHCDTGRIILASTQLASSPRSVRSMDSLVLMARGSGRIWVTLEHLDSTQLSLVAQGKIDSLNPVGTWASSPLESNWKRVSFRPSDFGPTSTRPKSVAWNRVRDSVNYITILIEGGSEMWIDDIRIHGINRFDLR